MFSNFRRRNKRSAGKSVLTAELQIFVDVARVTIEFPFNTLSSRAEVAFANFALDHLGRLVVQMLQTEDSHSIGKIFIALSRWQLSNLGTSDRFHSVTGDCRVVLCCTAELADGRPSFTRNSQFEKSVPRKHRVSNVVTKSFVGTRKRLVSVPKFANCNLYFFFSPHT